MYFFSHNYLMQKIKVKFSPILVCVGLLFAANTVYADVKMNCRIYQNGNLLTTQEKTLQNKLLNSAWARNHPDQFANNYFRRKLCESVGLAENRQQRGQKITGMKYHGITVYNNNNYVSTNCKVQCVRADGDNTQAKNQNNSLNAHQENTKTLLLATGYIAGNAAN